MKRPKILFVSSSWPGGKAFGGQMRALHIGRALKQIGDVSVVVVSADAGDLVARARTCEEFSVEEPILPEFLPNRGVVQRMRWAFDTRYLNVHGTVASRADRQRLDALCAKHDLVWVLNSRTPNILQKWDWEKAHLDVDDVPSTYLEGVARSHPTVLGRTKARILHALLHRRELLLRKRFATLSVCSADDRDYLGGGSQIHVIPNGFARPKEEPRRNAVLSPPRIGFIGLYDYAPNIDGVRWFLKECWPLIRKQVPGIRFRLAGAGTDGPSKPQDPDVDALGWLSDPAAEIATWSAMVIPIRFGGGTRIKVADGFSRKCPLVATTLGAFGYGVEDGKQLRLADDPAAFAAACVDLVRNPEGGVAMAERAWKEFTEKWTWDVIAPKVWKAAEDCLGRTSERMGHSISGVRVAGTSMAKSHGSAAVSDGDREGVAGEGRIEAGKAAAESILILIPTYNRAAVLCETLTAIEHSDWKGLDLQIVVIDNNSSDDTSERVSEFQGRLPLTLVREPRAGKNCALNKALQELPLRDFVVFIDDDITPAANWLHEMLAAGERWRDISAFGAKVRVRWPHGKQPEWAVADWVQIFGFARHDLGHVERPYEPECTPMGPCFWVRREVFTKVPRFDETIGPRPKNRIMGSEVSFLKQLERSGLRMVYCPGVEVEHRIEAKECFISPMLRRAYRCGRGEVRLYGVHRAQLRQKSPVLWNLTMLVDLVSYSGLRSLGSLLSWDQRRRAELALRAAVRVGKITESWRVVRGIVS